MKPPRGHTNEWPEPECMWCGKDGRREEEEKKVEMGRNGEWTEMSAT